MTRELASNGDYVDAFVTAAWDHLGALGRYVAGHPDEAAIVAVPVLTLSLATARHRLNFPERLLVAQVGYWCGLLAVAEYKRWKARPAGPRTLRKVAS